MEKIELDKEGVRQQTAVKQKVIHHGARWLRSKHTHWILGSISFAESSFAPIIIDPFLVAHIMATPEKWKRHVVVSIVASVLGGIFAYVLGALFFNVIGAQFLAFYGLHDQFAYLSDNLNNNGFVFVLIGAFTPIPYKIVALASGVLHINILTFLVASIFGRALRLGLVGFAAYSVGPKALPTIQKHLHIFAAIAGVILLVYIIIRLFS